MTAARTDLVRRLHGAHEPFDGFDPAGWADPTDEWDSHSPLFDQAVAELRPRVIVEVGSFLGASARHFAAALKREHVDGVVVCVDTWLGEQVLWNNPRWRPVLRITNGRPEYYKVFLANALVSGLWPYLCPLPMPSPNAARYLASKEIVADVIYIDGSHDEGDVRHDLELYWPLLRPGGWLLADDYHAGYPGVMADCDRFAAAHGLALEVNGIKARLRKG